MLKRINMASLDYIFKKSAGQGSTGRIVSLTRYDMPRPFQLRLPRFSISVLLKCSTSISIAIYLLMLQVIISRQENFNSQKVPRKTRTCWREEHRKEDIIGKPYGLLLSCAQGTVLHPGGFMYSSRSWFENNNL